MDTSVANIMDSTMSQLYQILAAQSSIPLSDQHEQSEHKHTSIIVFQRYIQEIKAVFFYAYDSTSFIIIQQQHIDVEQFTNNLNMYYQAIEKFLTSILYSNQEVCLHFINYGPNFIEEKAEIIQPALRLLELASFKSKIIIWMNNLQLIQPKDGYLMIQYLNQSVLLKFPENLIQNQEGYEQFALQQIQHISEIHKEFIIQLEQNEQCVKMYNIYSLIQNVTQKHNIPNSIYYLAKILVNLPKFTFQETLKMISKLRLYQQNQKQPNKENEGYKQMVLTQLAHFKEEKNHHFPMKGLHCQKCKVCQKQNNHKSSVICESCHKYYKIDVTLCAHKCFKQFHLNPAQYLRRKTKKKVKRS